MKLKIGIISDSDNLPKYDQELIGWIQKNNDKFDIRYQLNLSAHKKKFSFFSRVKKANLLLRIIKKIETWYTRKLNLIREYEIDDFNYKTLEKFEFKVNYINKYNRVELNDVDINKIKKLNLDVLIRCCGFILDGEILNTSKFGIISFHHGDNNNFRGGPPGFWEIFEKKVSSGFIIQRLDKNLDSGKKIFEGNFLSGINYAHNENILLKNSIIHFQNLLIYIFKEKKLPKQIINLPYKKKIYKTPNYYILILYIFKIYPKLILRLIQKKFKNKKVWSVMYNCENYLKTNNIKKFIKIENISNTFLADPFVFKENNKNYLLGEEFNFQKSKGAIAIYKINKKNYERLGLCLEENFHLSFPYIFKFENTLYMIPETLDINEIRIYKCEDFPLKWKYFKTIKKNISAVDSMLFFNRGLWWLFTNISNKKTDLFSTLNIFYSNNPISDDWKSHKKNPVIFDVNKSRNGGIILHKNKVFRVSQSPSFYEYGYETTISKIEILNPNDYKEKIVRNIKPNFKKGILGTHHFHNNQKNVAIDYFENKLFY